jgi:uncharacterized YigZ family protein
MATFSFFTIQNSTQGIYKEKGSKFLAFAFPVKSESEIKEQLDSLRKKYFDARHHCYAYVLGPDKTKFKAYDDGEPNHSASDPILGQIRSKNLTDVLVVVVRYFGGVKLGVGGLMQAYKAAAGDALNQVSVIEIEVTKKIELNFDYARTPEAMRLVKDFELKIIEQSFEESCQIRALLKLRFEDDLQKQREYLRSMGIEIISEASAA